MTRPATDSPSRPRASRTRDALLQAGLRLFAEKPVDAIPIDEIVAAAGVAKGSFFNHFADKKAFAAALAAQIRAEIESEVEAANRTLADPIARLAGGMRVAATFALFNRVRTRVLLRANEGPNDARHPLNAGVSRDVMAAVTSGSAGPYAADWGVLYWLGLCQALMTDIARRDLAAPEAARALSAMLAMGLIGIGADPRSAQALADREAAVLISQVGARGL
jgi:AcrR family transcriptional regulator